MLEPRPLPGSRKPIKISNKVLNNIKQSGKGERKTFSAPALSYVPPPAPKRRPTVPHIEPPPLSLTPASPDTNIGVHINHPTKKKPERSLNDYFAKSCPAYAPFLDFGGPDDLNLLDDGGKDFERSVGKRVSQLSTITEKVGSLSTSPTIISLLHTERLSAPKGRSSSLSSVSSVRDQRTHSVEDSKSGGDFDLSDLDHQLKQLPDDLQFEMETGSEAQLDGESGEFLPSFT
jgi:hypothetical protein